MRRTVRRRFEISVRGSAENVHVRQKVRLEATDSPLGHWMNRYTVFGAMVEPGAGHQRTVRKGHADGLPVIS